MLASRGVEKGLSVVECGHYRDLFKLTSSLEPHPKIINVINDIIEQLCRKSGGLLVISVSKRNKVSFTIEGTKLIGVKYGASDLFQAFTYRCYGNQVSAGKPP